MNVVERTILFVVEVVIVCFAMWSGNEMHDRTLGMILGAFFLVIGAILFKPFSRGITNGDFEFDAVIDTIIAPFITFCFSFSFGVFATSKDGWWMVLWIFLLIVGIFPMIIVANILTDDIRDAIRQSKKENLMDMID